MLDVAANLNAIVGMITDTFDKCLMKSVAEPAYIYCARFDCSMNAVQKNLANDTFKVVTILMEIMSYNTQVD